MSSSGERDRESASKQHSESERDTHVYTHTYTALWRTTRHERGRSARFSRAREKCGAPLPPLPPPPPTFCCASPRVVRERAREREERLERLSRVCVWYRDTTQRSSSVYTNVRHGSLSVCARARERAEYNTTTAVVLIRPSRSTKKVCVFSCMCVSCVTAAHKAAGRPAPESTRWRTTSSPRSSSSSSAVDAACRRRR